MSSSSYTATTTHVTRKFHWPDIQLNIWFSVVLAGSATCLGIFSWFMTVQAQMELPTPWVFPFMIATAALSLIFLCLIVFLAMQHSLIPEMIILGSFILFVLWFAGLIGTAVQLYGSKASINSNCQNWVSGYEFKGASINTLAWLTNFNICNCWKAAFAFEVVVSVFLIWMLVMAFQVRKHIDIF
ncbi:conserved hypothetical protein [Histoplasma capsulatum G186AR]|uniref:MARVEL domain-containing protein n=2 Tax=Ajellomyces capsulatus TaxID=5037 RepID=C0NV11_AJECG|nr:uncharacterized protein HCBG_06775 [Histoplasma capsulatum G186AR]EEH04824.1 conserved hypothetical protein [Histoplasma capsulatum G186AR]KAG5287480.1 hypothetical protein I7I52_11263 [Histoplasma capsulatum]KAG5296745.1 hypothetical protein I7I48_05662 [Histoplasma ohiense (nom. inval.)]QSS70707.1 hypothetical protein I7I50_12431 [Histoplasma capsulatum G186AR]